MGLLDQLDGSTCTWIPKGLQYQYAFSDLTAFRTPLVQFTVVHLTRGTMSSSTVTYWAALCWVRLGYAHEAHLVYLTMVIESVKRPPMN